eukprot:scaffold215805_cov17-Tisochrysis_lutea.AAC.1
MGFRSLPWQLSSWLSPRNKQRPDWHMQVHDSQGHLPIVSIPSMVQVAAFYSAVLLKPECDQGLCNFLSVIQCPHKDKSSAPQAHLLLNLPNPNLRLGPQAVHHCYHCERPSLCTAHTPQQKSYAVMHATAPVPNLLPMLPLVSEIEKDHPPFQ